MAAEILKALIAANLAAASTIVLLLLLGPSIRKAFGARMAYAAWLVVPFAAAATLLPARKILVQSMVTTQITYEALPAQGQTVDWNLALVSAWALGAIALIGLTFWTQARTLGLIGRLTPEDGRLRAANPAIGPAIVGIFRPKIMLPADFERRFDADERAVIMAHEETHLAGGDQRINALVELCRCLFWFNPFVHLAARRIRIDQELACDAAVIARFPKARRTYAEALLKTQTASAPLPLGCYWPERSHARLKERLTMLTMKTPGRARRVWGAACLAALGLGTGYAAWAAAPEAVPAPVAAPLPSLVPLPEPGPAAQQAAPNLTNSAPAPVDLEVRTEPVRDELLTFALQAAPPAGAGGETRRFIIGYDGQAGELPPELRDQMSGAVRLECSRSDDGPLACKRNGVAVEGEELERLKAAFPAMGPDVPFGIAARRLIQQGTGENRTVTVFQGRRLPE